MSSFADRTALFRQLHADGLLLIANAWDAGSARVTESLGVRAVATTSAGVAWAHGYADGDQLPVPRLLDTVADIVRVIDSPLTVDIEGGYSPEPAAVAATVLQLVRLGASGINLEDGDRDPGPLAAKIAAIRRACREAGVDVFINARTDVYLRQWEASGEACVQASLQRAAIYREAGADGIFVPGVVAAGEIEAIARQAGLPLNVLWRANLPDQATLQGLGVRRLSAGSDLAQAMAGQLRARTTAFLVGQPPLSVDPLAMGYGDLNALFPAG